MEFLKKIGFMKSDEEETSKPKTQAQKTVSPSNLGGLSAATTASIHVSSDSNYTKLIDEAIKEKDQPGLDFLEFTQDLSDLKDQPLTEEQKYKIVAPRFERAGMTTVGLIQSANTYLTVIDQVKADFDKELNGEKHQQITVKETQAQQASKEIDDLLAKIEERKSLITNLNAEVAQSKFKLELEERNFNISYEQKKNEVSNHIANIQKYIGNVKPAGQNK